MDSTKQPDLPGDGTTAETGVVAPVIVPTETNSVARELATSYRRMVKIWQEHLKLSPAEAIEYAERNLDNEYRDRVMNLPADQITWDEISNLAQFDSETMYAVWERVKGEARDELAMGHRAARAMEGHDPTPWERARFLAVRDDLSADWQPRNGIERMLIDMLTQAYVGYETWMKTLVVIGTTAGAEAERGIWNEGKWKPTRISTAETIEQTGAMVDRYHRMLIRVQRALRDQRRYGLNVGSVGQLNIGLVQQNVARPELNGTALDDSRVLNADTTQEMVSKV